MKMHFLGTDCTSQCHTMKITLISIHRSENEEILRRLESRIDMIADILRGHMILLHKLATEISRIAFHTSPSSQYTSSHGPKGRPRKRARSDSDVSLSPSDTKMIQCRTPSSPLPVCEFIFTCNGLALTEVTLIRRNPRSRKVNEEKDG